jgi:hypothetical protein
MPSIGQKRHGAYWNASKHGNRRSRNKAILGRGYGGSSVQDVRPGEAAGGVQEVAAHRGGVYYYLHCKICCQVKARDMDVCGGA